MGLGWVSRGYIVIGGGHLYGQLLGLLGVTVKLEIRGWG